MSRRCANTPVGCEHDSQDDSAIERDVEFARAVGSSQSRRALLLDSLAITASNPLFGVGPGNFTPHAADLAKAEGRHGMWQVTHNSS